LFVCQIKPSSCPYCTVLYPIYLLYCTRLYGTESPLSSPFTRLLDHETPKSPHAASIPIATHILGYKLAATIRYLHSDRCDWPVIDHHPPSALAESEVQNFGARKGKRQGKRKIPYSTPDCDCSNFQFWLWHSACALTTASEERTWGGVSLPKCQERRHNMRSVGDCYNPSTLLSTQRTMLRAETLSPIQLHLQKPQ
jgi:hypothetical protein